MSEPKLFKTINPPGSTLAKEEILKEIRETEDRTRLRLALPYKFGWKNYLWAEEFSETRKRFAFLTAANQVSKSSTLIRLAIDWATDKKKWPDLWDHEPNLFWFVMPTQQQINTEFLVKWSQFLPRNGYEESDEYGFTIEKEGKDIRALHFRSGVHIYFKTYGQGGTALQSSTVDAMFLDEEPPEVLFEELKFRLVASNGYMRVAFTATLGQEMWRRCMEPRENEEEFLPEAFKRTVSLYDAMFYSDGTPSHWTAEKIQGIRAACKSNDEIQKRIYGRFIVLTGRIYQGFDAEKHIKPKHQVPKSWLYFSGVDIGSGSLDSEAASEKGHKSAIVFLAVRPDFRAGRIFAGWRGDNQKTTAGDVVEKYLAMKKEFNLTNMTGEFYDYANSDFLQIANRMGGASFQSAEKGNQKGFEIVNTLFQNDMLAIYESPENMKLAGELLSLLHSTRKDRRKDDFADALRYAVAKIGWDFSCVTAEGQIDLDDQPERVLTPMQEEVKARRKEMDEGQASEEAKINAEFEEINDSYGY